MFRILVVAMGAAGIAAIALVVLTELSWVAGVFLYAVGGSLAALVVSAFRAFVRDVRAHRSVDRDGRTSRGGGTRSSLAIAGVLIGFCNVVFFSDALV